MHKKIFGVLGIGALLVGVVLSSFLIAEKTDSPSQPPTFSGAPDAFIIDSWNVNTSSTIDVGARQILSANTGRVYARFTNDSDTAIYLNLSTASTTASAYAIRLNANGGTYDIGPTNLYTGAVYASTTAAGKRMLTVEK